MPDIVLITTLIVSIGDLLVNIGGLCFKGRLKINMCDCFTFDHREEDDGITQSEAELIATNAIRRASQPNNIHKKSEETTN